MYGQKQIFQCLAVIALITVLNFYRSAIRRDKEIQKSLKLKREQQEKVQLDAAQTVLDTLPKQFSDGDGSQSADKWTQPQCISDECKTVKNNPFAEHESESMYKNADIDGCDNDKKTCSTTDQIHSTTTTTSGEALDADRHRYELKRNEHDSGDNMKAAVVNDDGKDSTKNHQKPQQRAKGPTTTSKTKANKRIINQIKINGSHIETTGVLTCIAVIILFVSLIKAAVDVSKHIREKRQQNNMDDNELLRRCSLQEYSMVKQQQLQQQQHQQNINGKRKSVSKITELMPQSSVDSGCNNAKIKEQSRRMSTNPQDYLNGSGILTEPGSPAKPGKLLAKLATRRPSMDSVSEDDNSSPDVKRRVRMINRH